MDFDFGEGSPGEGITADQFSIAWDGSLLATDTGWHEFRLSTPNGARLYLNADLREGDSNRRDDSDASRETALIDGWVSSGAMVREETGTRRSCSAAALIRCGSTISNSRKSRLGESRVEAAARRVERACGAVSFAGAGRERGGRLHPVSARRPQRWLRARHRRFQGLARGHHLAALEAANEVVDAPALAQRMCATRPTASSKLQHFVATFAERAFRRPLTDEARSFRRRAFAGACRPGTAVKRAVLLVLKSPRFLYPELGANRTTSPSPRGSRSRCGIRCRTRHCSRRPRGANCARRNKSARRPNAWCRTRAPRPS